MTMMREGVITATAVNRGMMGTGHGSMHGAAGMMAHDDNNSVLLEPGEAAELVWTFTSAAELEFACNVPGHYQMGMVGHIEFGD